MKTDSVVGVNGPEPYNKYTRQGAQDGSPAAYLCTYLDNHGFKPLILEQTQEPFWDRNYGQ